MNINKLISVTQICSEQQREIAEVIGIEAYRKLVEHYGGSKIYIAKYDTITRPDRNNEIKQKFNGGNYRQLALEYNLAEVTVRNIVNGKK